MMLIFQIAAGIVLGCIVIKYHVVLLRWSMLGLSVLLSLVVLGAVAWAFVSLGDTSRLDDLVIGLIFLASFALGLFGLRLLSAEVLPHGRVANWPAGLKTLLAVLAAHLYLATGFVSQLPAFRGTLIGDLSLGIDGWSRSNGWADTGVMMVAALTLQWSWIAYVVVRKLGGKPLFQDSSLAGTDLAATEKGAEDG